MSLQRRRITTGTVRGAMATSHVLGSCHQYPWDVKEPAGHDFSEPPQSVSVCVCVCLCLCLCVSVSPSVSVVSFSASESVSVRWRVCVSLCLTSGPSRPWPPSPGHAQRQSAQGGPKRAAPPEEPD